MLKRKTGYAVCVFILLWFSAACAQTPKGPPPANVKVARITQGRIAPQTAFVGSVMYPEVADLASEVSGKVETVEFEEGQRVIRGAVLVTLNSDLLQRTLESNLASYQQALTELEKARIDYGRIHNLFKEESIAEQVYDDARFKVKGLDKKAQSLKAEVERLRVELEKKSVRATFDGVVMRRSVDRGEWVSEGTPVASVARDDMVDVMVDVPESVVAAIKPDAQVLVGVAGHEAMGEVFAIIPRGDVATRTFPIKVRMKNTLSLIQGMEARVSLPSGQSMQALLVPRDAVIKLFGVDVVFTVDDSKAHMLPVKILGYDGMHTAVEAEGLQEGMLVVVKGNERLREGQPVNFDLPQAQS